ncbi:MAG: NAD(P)H-hydrate dehydratase [Candidatus Eremiobacteraeota bacterium]|nr:NAD(P)H-hydrate dehydratase [Candidatus Eremiobacteraeota bacterium]
MRAADAAAVAERGDVALMRAAGDAVAEAVRVLWPRARRIVAFAGPGNNGGDAYAALASAAEHAHLHARAREWIVYALAAASPSSGRRDAENRAQSSGIITRPFPRDAGEAERALEGADLVLDAMLGTGSRPDVPEPLRSAIEALSTSAVPVLAIDIPTGIDPTTGAVAETAVRAHATVTLGAPKLGLLLEPARGYAGSIFVGDLHLAAELARAEGTAFAALDTAEFLALLPRRGEEADKRESGAPLIVAGSEQFPGAAVLCAHGAARAGAGYVTVASSSDAAPALRAHLVEQVVVTFEEANVERAIDDLLDLTNRSNAVGLGPGLALSAATGAVVRGFVERLERPFVADASALFHLGKHLDILRGKRCVLTPHEREFARLSGEGTIVPGTRVARLRSFVARTGVTTLLKGNATLIDDGSTMHVNVTGSNALATAGTGDVLTGVIATLLSQGLAPVDAARVGAYWHGLAGREAAHQRPVGVMAGDVAEALGPAIPEPPERFARLVPLS